MRRWARDLALGVRLVARGGRGAWTRLTLTAVGVGLGVALLLLAASVPAVLTHRDDRTNARDFNEASGRPTDTSVLYRPLDTEYHGEGVYALAVQALGAHPAVPPGVSRLPGPGEMVVSPRFRAALDAPDGALLRERYPYRVVGTIGDEGLSGPREYSVYLGSDTLTGSWRGNAQRLDRWGSPTPDRGMDPVLLLVTVLGIAALLVPVAVFVATAVRFGSEARDRQQAALRLVGADRATTRRTASAEALLGALAGLVVGAGFFLAGRRLVELLSFDDISVFAGDLTPDPVLAVLVAVGLPVAAVLITLVALRRVAAEPLGVVRRSTTRRRRLWWRLVPPVVGLGLLVPLAGRVTRSGGSLDTAQVAAGLVLVLAGTAVLLPWLVERVVGRMGGGGVARLLAVRRLQADSGGAARTVSGITVAVAGAIALQTLFAGVAHGYEKPTHQDPRAAQAIVTDNRESGPAQRAALAAGLRRSAGVHAVYAFGHGAVFVGDDGGSLVVGDCATLRAYAGVAGCADGDVFTIGTDRSPAFRPGSATTLLVGAQDRELRWRIPATARTAVRSAHGVEGDDRAVLLTPKAAAASPLPPAMPTTAYVRADLTDPLAYDRLETAAARVDPLIDVMRVSGGSVDAKFATVRTGLLIGSIAVLLVIGASLLVTVLEQLRARRRPLAVLAAFGTRRGTVGRSVLWQTAIPVLLGLALAVLVGVVLGGVLLRMTAEPLWFDWSGILGVTGAGAGVVLLVTALTLPAVWRMMRPGAMRTE